MFSALVHYLVSVISYIFLRYSDLSLCNFVIYHFSIYLIL